jgi:hypothetical protein
MGISTVVVTESTYSVVIVEDGEQATVVTPPTAINVEVKAPGPAGPAGEGVPSGGATGDLLVKTSATNYATAWTDAPTVDLLGFDLAAAEEVSTGQLAWNADEGTLELGKLNGVSNYLGAETMVLCRNNSNTVAIAKGTAVMFVGTVGNSGRLKVAPMVANGTLPGYVFLGVTDQSIAGASDGYVSVFGKIRGINTSTYADGDILWCNPAVAGGFTTTEPQAPNLKLAVAAVINAANNGSIFVRATTGSRLQDLHDVEANGNKDDGDVLTWSATAGRWEPAVLPLPPISPLLLSQQVIAENYTITSGYNGVSAGDVDVAATYTVTVPSGATWVIV